MTDVVSLPDSDTATLVGGERPVVAKPTEPLFRDGAMVAGRYRVLRYLARGGMGEVYEAEDVQLGQRVALKAVRPDVAFHPQTLDRFRREINLARQVTHRNVCRIYEYGIHGDPSSDESVRFLTMELLHGETLSARLKRDGPMSCEEALPILRQILRGLRIAHQEEIVHRDFKPSNVMLEETPRGLRAVITDFGLSQRRKETEPRTDGAASTAVGARRSEDDEDRITGSGQLMGTLAYISPEQLEGEEATTVSDLYSLGVVLYEMLTGHLPFKGDSPLLVALQRLDEEPCDPREHCPELEERWHKALLRCLERDPSRRFQDADEVIEAIDPTPPPERAVPRALLVAFVGVLLLAGFLGWQLIPSGEPLRVAIATPELTEPIDNERYLTSSFESALERGLLSLEDVRVIDAANPSRPPSEIAAREAADEVITLKIEQNGARLDLALRRVSPSGEALSLEPFSAPLGSGKVQAETVMAALRRVYPDRRQTAQQEPTAEQWERFLDLNFQRTALPDGKTWNHLYNDAEQLAGSAPDFVEAQILQAHLAQIMFSQTRQEQYHQDAHRAIMRADELRPNDPRPLVYQAMLAQRLDQFQQAEDVIEQLEDRFPGDVEVLESRAGLARRRGNLAGAESILEEALELRPTDSVVSSLAGLYIESGKEAEARFLLEDQMAKRPNDPFLQSLMAYLEMYLGDVEVSVEIYEDLVANHPSVTYRNNLGLAYLFTGRLEESLQVFQRLRQDQPNHTPAALNYADLLKLAGRESEAAKEYERVLVLSQKNEGGGSGTEAALAAAQAYAHLGRFNEAIDTIERTLASAPEDTNAIYSAAIVYALAGAPDEGRRYAVKALEAGLDERLLDLPWLSVLEDPNATLTIVEPM